MGAVQENFPNAPTIGPSQLGVLKSVGDIADFLSSGNQGSSPVAETVNSSTSTPTVQTDNLGGKISEFLIQTIF